MRSLPLADRYGGLFQGRRCVGPAVEADAVRGLHPSAPPTEVSAGPVCHRNERAAHGAHARAIMRTMTDDVLRRARLRRQLAVVLVLLFAAAIVASGRSVSDGGQPARRPNILLA